MYGTEQLELSNIARVRNFYVGGDRCVTGYKSYQRDDAMARSFVLHPSRPSRGQTCIYMSTYVHRYVSSARFLHTRFPRLHARTVTDLSGQDMSSLRKDDGNF